MTTLTSKHSPTPLTIDVKVKIINHLWNDAIRRQTPFVGEQGVIDKDYKDGSYKVRLDDGSFRWFYADELGAI